MVMGRVKSTMDKEEVVMGKKNEQSRMNHER